MVQREKIFFGLLFCGVLLTPFLFFDSLYESSVYPRKCFLWIMTATLWIVSPPLRFQKNPLFFPVVGFFFFSSLSFISAVDRSSFFLREIEWIGYFLLCFMISACSFRQMVPFILLAAIASATAISWIGLAQFYANFSYYPQTIAPAATFLNKNFAAEYLVLLLPISFLGSFSASRGAPFCKVAFLFQSLYLFQTRTRGSWVGVVFSFLFFFMMLLHFSTLRTLLYRKRSFWLLLAFPCLLATTLFWTPSVSDPSTTPTASSEMQRITLWANASVMFQDHFWNGVGFGNFYAVYPLYHRKMILDTTFSLEKQPYELHQDFLQMFVECGIGGGLAFLWILFRVGQIFWQRMHSVSQEEQLWICGIALGLIAMCGQACFSFPFRNPTSAFQFWVGVGILLAPQEAPEHSSAFWLWNIAGVFLWLATFFFSVLLCVSNFYLKKAKFASSEGQSFQALQLISFANAYFPWDSSIWREWSILQVQGSQDWKKNLQVLEWIQQRDPYYLNNLINLALTAVKTKQYERAKQLYETVLQIYPDEFHCFLGLGLLYLEQEQPDQARIYLQKAYQQKPTHPLLKQFFQNR